MASKKYNWIKWKQKFFESEIDEVEEFFRQEVSNYKAIRSGHFNKKTAGWAQEKQAYKESILQLSLKKARTKATNCLHKAMIEGFYILAERISDSETSTGNIISIWEVIKTELGEPIKIQGNEFHFRKKGFQEMMGEKMTEMKEMEKNPDAMFDINNL